MMICCAAPLLLIVLSGFGGKAFGASTWVVIGGVVVMVVAHFAMMGVSQHSDEERVADGENKDKVGEDHNDHSSHGCCH